MSGKRKGARKTISLFIKAEQLKAIFWNIFFVQQWNNDQKEKIILASISQRNDIDSPLKWNCSVKNPSTITSLHFLLTLHFAPSLISQPWSFTRLRYIIYLSVFPAWLFFGPGVRGWNKADPVLKLTGSPKPEPEGSPPSPGLTEAASDKGAVCYELLRGKKRNTTGRVIWCSFDPLSPLRWKGFQFLPDKEDHFSTEQQHGLQSSAEILIRDKLLYIVRYTLLHRRGLKGQRGRK